MLKCPKICIKSPKIGIESPKMELLYLILNVKKCLKKPQNNQNQPKKYQFHPISPQNHPN
jgi:hypothetical protein